MRRWEAFGVMGLALLAGCGGGIGRAPDQSWSSTLSAVQTVHERGEVGGVEGFLYLREPAVPTPLFDQPVILIPLPPTLEQALDDVRRRYTASGFEPLQAGAFAKAHEPIDAYLHQLRTGTHRTLLRTTKTEPAGEPRFRFQDVPAGRWLLLAKLASPISTLLWAVPVTVQAGSSVHQSLNDQNIWVEGLR